MYRRNAATGQEWLYFWWGGQLLMRYYIGYDGTTVSSSLSASYQYFAGRRVGEVNDRLSSEMSGGKKYYPYGEERSTTADGAYKFATYWREGYGGLDYADQRWYSSLSGRFTTPDPYQASGGVGNPGSWNRYAYVEGDPVNRVDPAGLISSETIQASRCMAVAFWDWSIVLDPGCITVTSPYGVAPAYAAMLSSPNYGAGGGQDNRSYAERLERAGRLALAALLQPKCLNELFGGVDPLAPDSPYLILAGLLDGTSPYGAISAESLVGGPLVAAETWKDVGPIEAPEDKVHIVINTDGAFMKGYRDVYNILPSSRDPYAQDTYRAITLIHELGHLLSAMDLPSSIPFGAHSAEDSKATSKRVFEACFQ